MRKSQSYLIVLVSFISSCAFAQQLSILNEGKLNGQFAKKVGAENGKSISINQEENAYKISLSGEESWAGVYVTGADDKPYDLKELRYLLLKVKTSEPIVIEKIGYGDGAEPSELIRKLKLKNEWKTIVLELPKEVKELNAAFAFITVGKVDLYISKIQFFKEVPETANNTLKLISAPYNKVEDAKYIFSEGSELGALSGYSGEKNGASMLIDDHCMESPYQGKYCLKIAVDDKEAWRMLTIQVSGLWTNALSEDTELPDLSEYTKLVFYARTPEKNYFIPQISFGAESTRFYQEPRDIVYVTVSDKWSRYEISLKGLDRSSVNDVFVILLNEGTLYLDEIRFEK